MSRAGPLFSSTPTFSNTSISPTNTLNNFSSEKEDFKSSLMVVSQEHFDQLFNLLKLSDSISIKTFQLLKLLPLHPGILEKYLIFFFFFFDVFLKL